MRIGLIDVDGHNFPNIPLMKISAWHKQQGDSVEWYDPLFSGHMDIVYMSKVFSFTPDYPYVVDANKLLRGGLAIVLNWLMARRYTILKTTSLCRMRLSTSIQTIRCTPTRLKTLPSDF